MKKIWALLLVSFLLIGCSRAPEIQQESVAAEQSSEINEGEESKNDSIPFVEESEESEEESILESEPEENEVETPVDFEELTVVDNDECVIRIVGIEPDNAWGYTLKVYLENKSTDKTYMFSNNYTAVNSVEVDSLFVCEVAAGKKANDELNILDSSIEEAGITDFTDIEISFRVYDTDDWLADDVAEETIHIYPYGEENATVFERKTQDSDNILVDNEYVTVTVTGFENDSIWGYTAKLFLQNKTDVSIMVTADESSVNGYMIDPFFATTVMPGKSKFSDMRWSTTDFEKNKITDVEEIEFILRVYNEEDWLADDLVKEKISLNP